jgi:hypothetical protein
VKKVRVRSHVSLARVNSNVFHEAIYKGTIKSSLIYQHNLPLKAPGLIFRLEAQRANYFGALIPADAVRRAPLLYRDDAPPLFAELVVRLIMR